MPRIRPEQIASYGISDLQIAANAAIKQAKIADQISDPQGWISKGTINVISSFAETVGGYQEFGMTISGADDSGLSANTVYYFEVNGQEYSIDTTGQATPISYNTVVSLMETEVTGSGITVLITGSDIRISSTTSGYDANVFINPNCTRHRLHDYLVGFTSFEEPVKGSGVNWDGSQAGRIFFAEDTNETWMGISTDPYYQAFGSSAGGESIVETMLGSETVDWDGTTGRTFRSSTGFAPDSANLFVYFNGQLLEFSSTGTADYQLSQGIGVGGEYTDIVLNSGFIPGAEDKVTAIIYTETELTAYATKAYVNDKLSNGVELSGDTTIDGDVLPGQNAIHDIGAGTNTWSSIYLNDSIYFRPIDTGDNLRIYRNVVGANTELRFQIGSSENDKFIFEDENNNSILTIDGNGNVAIGNLNVAGTTTTINSTETTVNDASFIIKTAVTPVDGDAEYQVQRASGDVSLKWNDSIDRWQAVYGQTANITGDILTSDDFANGKNLDGRYVNQTQIVASGSTENDGAIKYGGSFTTGVVDPLRFDGSTATAAPSSVNGAFYGGLDYPSNTTRLNYNGELHVTSLYAEDVYVSASSLYVNGKKVLEEDASGAMTFSADTDQSLQLKSIGTEGDIDLISVDNITGAAAGHMDFTITGGKAGKNLSFSNTSSGGEIQFAATGSSGVIQVQAGGPTADVVNIDTTTNPPSGTTRLNIHGNVYASSLNGKLGTVAFNNGTTDPTGTDRLNVEGYLYATRVYNAVWNDLAEFMPKAESADPGQVMVMTANGLVPSKKRGDKAVVGVYSDSFGYALGAEDQENKIPVGISGRVWVSVREPMEIGDLLISGPDGFAVKATAEEALTPGIVIGKVMEDKKDNSLVRIPILIMNR